MAILISLRERVWLAINGLQGPWRSEMGNFPHRDLCLGFIAEQAFSWFVSDKGCFRQLFFSRYPLSTRAISWEVSLEGAFGRRLRCKPNNFQECISLPFGFKSRLRPRLRARARQRNSSNLRDNFHRRDGEFELR
jgi:hypothetical protein